MERDMYTHRNEILDSPVKDGILSGKRVIIQPNMSVRGWLADAGSRALEGYVALEDATAIARLKDGGAVITGSCRMGELGFGIQGETCVDILSAGEADLALMTDMMGEARLSAAAAGIFGYKPSFAVISRFGLIGLVPSMECFGVMAKDPEDIITAVGVMAGGDENDPSMAGEYPDFAGDGRPTARAGTAGVIKESLQMLGEEEMGAFEMALARLEETGYAVVELEFRDYPLFRSVHNVIASVEASSGAGKYDGVRYGHRCDSANNWNDMYLLSRGESFGTLVKTFLFQGAYFQFENYGAFENACRIRRRLVEGFDLLLDSVDLIVSPTRRPACDAARAATIKDIYDAFSLTLPANITGLPSVHTPSLALCGDVDVGLQLTGRRLDDRRLLCLSMELASLMEGA